MLSLFIISFVLTIVWIRSKRLVKTVAFFHPYCNAGGGGERVLWCALNAMQDEFSDSNVEYAIFTGDLDATPDQILERAKIRFNVEVNRRNLRFVYLRTRWLVEAENYPRFTLLLQTLAGFILGCEALWKVNPAVFIDSMGYPLTLPLFRWIAGSKVACYVHYPTITNEMINLVESRKISYNNSALVAYSSLLTTGKVLYYRMFAWLYRLCGKCSNVVMVNGSWTENHINELWKVNANKIFPPCDVSELMKLPKRAEQILASEKLVKVLSIGQIRPEKNYPLQIETIAEVKRRLSEYKSPIKVRLAITGSCRHEEDLQRAKALEESAQKEFGLTDEDVEWNLNVPIDKLRDLLQTSLIGIHTMWNEHFGISVVEGIAAGSIMIAHNSGGPKLDIIKDDEKCGFLAENATEYADAILKIINMTEDQRNNIRVNARERAKKFNEESFARSWNSAISIVI